MDDDAFCLPSVSGHYLPYAVASKGKKILLTGVEIIQEKMSCRLVDVLRKI